MKTSIFTALALLLVERSWGAPHVASLGVDTRNISEIYAAALRENGTLQIAYGGDEKSQSAPFVKAFEAAFPGISINATTDLSKYHDGRINRALLAGESYADIAILQTLHDFDWWKDRGVLLNYKPPGFDELYTSITDPDGAYLPAFLGGFGSFVYDTARVKAGDVPNTYLDVLQPKWKGKIALTYPNDDDAINFLFSTIVSKYGLEWLERLQQQDIKWVRGTATPAELMAEPGSQYVLTWTGYPATANQSLAPPEDNYMSWAQTSAIFKNTKMPETAKLVQAFLTSESYQASQVSQGSFSTRKDVSANSTVWTAEWSDPVRFHQFMLQRDVVEAWRFQFEDVLGTAQGISPLIDSIGS